MTPACRKTARACYAADVIQAIVINITPIVFVFLRQDYGLRYSQFGTLVLANFTTQVAVDLLFSRPVDRCGYRPFVVGAHLLCSLGFFLFALTPRFCRAANLPASSSAPCSLPGRAGCLSCC